MIRKAQTNLPRPSEDERVETIREFVMRKLDESRSEPGQRGAGWTRLSKETGVPYFTIAKLAQGVTPNPRAETLEPLLAHFDYVQNHRRVVRRAA